MFNYWWIEKAENVLCVWDVVTIEEGRNMDKVLMAMTDLSLREQHVQ